MAKKPQEGESHTGTCLLCEKQPSMEWLALIEHMKVFHGWKGDTAVQRVFSGHWDGREFYGDTYDIHMTGELIPSAREKRVTKRMGENAILWSGPD